MWYLWLFKSFSVFSFCFLSVFQKELFEEHSTSTADVKQALREHLNLNKGDPNMRYEHLCDFDQSNKKSPCFYKFKSQVEREEETNFPFIRYVMDYCQEFEDRGCVINKPLLLNKLMKEEFDVMASSESIYNNAPTTTARTEL